MITELATSQRNRPILHRLPTQSSLPTSIELIAGVETPIFLTLRLAGQLLARTRLISYINSINLPMYIHP
jgi:hypothetical protein